MRKFHQTFRMSSTTVNCVPSSIKYFIATNICYVAILCLSVTSCKNFDGVHVGTPDECHGRVHDEIEMLAQL